MRLFKYMVTILLTSLLIQSPAHAALELLLTQGVDSALPIAVVPFAGQEADARASDNVAAVISADLRNSGRFKVLPLSAMPGRPRIPEEVNASAWHATGVDSTVVGSVKSVGGDRYKVHFALLDVYKNAAKTKTSDLGSVLVEQEFTVPGGQLRRLSHHIADIIYEKLTGVRGVFATRIAYVLVQGNNRSPLYSLQVADADGFNPKPILTSKEPIMSPAWSHDGKQVAYVSFENRRAQIYISTVATGSRRIVSKFPGINGAPAWSPDDRKLAMVLSKGGAPKIYVLDLASGALQQVTQGQSIDTEPTWSPDGRSIVFTSDRGGAPQLYRVSLGNGQTERVTFSGAYNARGSFSPDGQRLVMLRRDNGMYNIAIQDLPSGRSQVLTRSGRDESPSLSANGNMVLYGTEYGELALVSTDGRVSLRLPAQDGKVQSPAWSPFLQ